jgi:hypothetical protein
VDDVVFVKQFEYDPEEDENDPDQMKLVEPRSNDPISDETFRAEGIEVNTFVITSLLARPVMGLDTPDDPPDQVLEAPGPVSSKPDDESQIVIWPPFDPGTVFLEKSTGRRLKFVLPAVNNRWVMVDEERQHLRRMLPDELVKFESVLGAP